MGNHVVLYSVRSPSGLTYRGIFFAKNNTYIKRMFDYRSLTINWTIFLPLWLSSIIIYIFKHLPFSRIKVQHIQGVFSQIHNALNVGKHLHEQTIALIFNNPQFTLRHELICIHQDILDGKHLSISLSKFLGNQYSVLASLLVESEKRDSFESAIHEVSNAISQLAEQKIGLINLVISFFSSIIVSIYFAHLLASLYIAPRVGLIKLVGGKIPTYINYYHTLFAAPSTLTFLVKVLISLFIVILAFASFRSTKYYPKILYRIEIMLPIIGNYQRSLTALLLIRGLGIGFKSNLRMVNVLHQASLHTRNKVIKERLVLALDYIKQGNLPIIAVTRSKLLPFRYRYLFNQLLREADSSTSINNILKLANIELKQFYTLVKEGTKSSLLALIIGFNVSSLWAYIYTSIEYNKYMV
jgi:type II secretory pathway component PulF